MSNPATARSSIPNDYNAATDFVDRNVAEGRTNKTAFIDPAQTLSYGGLRERSNQFANALLRLALVREQRIALIMLDTVAMPVAFWGSIRAGIVPIPLNTLLTTEQYCYILQDSRAAAIVVSAELMEKVEPVLGELPELRIVVMSDGEPARGQFDFNQLLATSSTEADTASTCADEVAFWLYSSGSTGDPKGVKHLHASLMHTARLYGQQVLGIREDDKVFSAAKLFFAYGLGNAMSFPMSVGATTVLLPERPTPDAVFALMRSHNPTIFYGVPTLYAAMLASPGLKHGAGSERLRICVSAGEALPKEVGERWREATGSNILDGIGSTEMLHIFLSNRPDALTYGSSGLPVPGYEARLVGDDGGDVTEGEIGELIVRGPSAGEGYWNKRNKTRATFVGEWTYTGDKYRREADGLYYYCGRTDDMFKVSGSWVSPFEVESALVSHAAVLEAAVIGKEDEDGLMKPKAFIVLNEGHLPNDTLFSELKEHVKETAGPWKYPRWIDVRSELPKTATGKIQRFKLRSGD